MQNKVFFQPKFLLLAIILAIGFFSALPKRASAQLVTFPVGGIFLPGLIDIFTPVPFCGLVVSVIGPHGGVFVWGAFPPNLYSYFPETFEHVGDNMLGQAVFNPNPLCPDPILYMVGSSLIPL